MTFDGYIRPDAAGFNGHLDSVKYKRESSRSKMSKMSPFSITVYRGFAALPTHTWSPFVNKLETRLRLSGIPYQVKVGSIHEGPKRKIPYIALELDNGGSEMLGDTALISKRLVEVGVFPHELNKDLTPVQKAQDLAIRSLLEDKLSFYLARERWIDNFYTMRDGAMASVPYPVRVLVGHLAYRGVSRSLYGQGTGRFTDDEVRMFKMEIWEHLNILLGEARGSVKGKGSDEPFWILGGEKPTEADTTAYGIIVASLICDA
ncbi:hypothetical protein QBC35DRAFT_487869 [Podospora australis]|uniref:Thioredoxin-like fold domain-containing protein n=1 Tax=Podospora australis TaxID=1536484 RepID=A0AAN6X398_9PEZI|nr:hypothetical protein QBC35DRAFT_487869 [Podospora australis]